MFYTRVMGEPADVSIRELRNHVSEIMRRVQAGERVRVTSDRQPVAQIIPLPVRRQTMSGAELLAWRRGGHGPDADLAHDLAEVLTETTDDVDVE